MTTLAALQWEEDLLSLAEEAHVTAAPAQRSPTAGAARLSQAYDHCAALTATHSRSFSLATGLLPVAKRRAMRALYAFCRVSDDIVDRPAADAERRLDAWRLKALAKSTSWIAF